MLYLRHLSDILIKTNKKQNKKKNRNFNKLYRKDVGDLLSKHIDNGGCVSQFFCNAPPSGTWDNHELYCPVVWKSIYLLRDQSYKATVLNFLLFCFVFLKFFVFLFFLFYLFHFVCENSQTNKETKTHTYHTHTQQSLSETYDNEFAGIGNILGPHWINKVYTPRNSTHCIFLHAWNTGDPFLVINANAGSNRNGMCVCVFFLFFIFFFIVLRFCAFFFYFFLVKHP